LTIDVIGVGLGRTGTESLKSALEVLGYGPCFHYFQLLRDGDRLEHWEQLERGNRPDYAEMFQGYRSITSSLSAVFHRQLLDEFPAAKCVLTVRDADAWYRSVSSTVTRGMPAPVTAAVRALASVSTRFDELYRLRTFTERFLDDGLFGGRVDDAEFVKSVFVRWNAEIRGSIPAEQLLVYDVADGWAPLCAFLQVPVPDQPFPHHNVRQNFRRRLLADFFFPSWVQSKSHRVGELDALPAESREPGGH
jgi:hypothetical protein